MAVEYPQLLLLVIRSLTILVNVVMLEINYSQFSFLLNGGYNIFASNLVPRAFPFCRPPFFFLGKSSGNEVDLPVVRLSVHCLPTN